MQVTKWDEDLNTGYRKIDVQHQEIFKQFDIVMNSLKNGKGKEVIEKTLNFMENYIVEHFHEEEKLQLASGYPMYSRHKSFHDNFIKELQSLRKKYKEDGASSPVAIKLNSMLMGWFRNHINKMDKEVARHVKIK